MARVGVLKPVHFLKVSHHGSHNGTPADDVFEAILPAAPPDNRKRQAVISTWEDTTPAYRTLRRTPGSRSGRPCTRPSTTGTTCSTK